MLGWRWNIKGVLICKPYIFIYKYIYGVISIVFPSHVSVSGIVIIHFNTSADEIEYVTIPFESVVLSSASRTGELARSSSACNEYGCDANAVFVSVSIN